MGAPAADLGTLTESPGITAMNTQISPAVLAFAAEQLHWRIDTPAERERMAADLALLMIPTPDESGPISMDNLDDEAGSDHAKR